MTEVKKAKVVRDVSAKIHTIMASIHQAFMQPRRQSNEGESLRKAYWIKAWSETKQLSAKELEELTQAIETIQETLGKLKEKVESLRTKKLKARAERHALENLNEWEEDEFLDSAAVLPVFSEKKPTGKRWVISQCLDKPKTVTQVCQAVWTVITNRAITIVDKGKANVQPNQERDVLIESHRLAVLPNLLDDKTITDPLSGKPLMNLFMINSEVKETLLWLLAERAKKETLFRKLFIRFLTNEIVKKAKLYTWANKYMGQAQQILAEISNL